MDAMDATMTLADGYNRTKTPATATYRPMTVSEAKALNYGNHVTMRANDGTARTLKVNGRPKTWKRDDQRVEVPVKYGMYEYATMRNLYDGTIGSGSGAILVVKVG